MGLFKRAGSGAAASSKIARRRGRWQSCLFFSGLLFLPGVVILGGVASSLYGAFVQRELDVLEAEIRAKGEPVTPEELVAYERDVLEKSGAGAYLNALALVGAIIEEKRARISPDSIESAVRAGVSTDETIAPVRAWLESRQNVLDAVAEAVYQEPADRNHVDTAQWGVMTRRTVYDLEEVVWGQGLVALHDRDWEAFVAAQELSLHLAETFAGSKYLLFATRHTLELLRAAIITGEIPSSVFERISRKLARIDTQVVMRGNTLHWRVIAANGLRKYYEGEEVEEYIDAFVPLRTWCYRRLGGVPGYRCLAVHDILWQTRFHTAVVDEHGLPWRTRYENAVARQPFEEMSSLEGDMNTSWQHIAVKYVARLVYPQVSDCWWERRSVNSDGVLSSRPLSLLDGAELLFYPEKHTKPNWYGHPLFDVEDSTEMYMHLEIQLRSVRLAMLIDAHRQQTGILPDSLDVLDATAVAAIGGDPYVDGPLGYRVVEDGFLLYSVGSDLEDDGGESAASASGDVIERFVKERPAESGRQRRESAQRDGGTK